MSGLRVEYRRGESPDVFADVADASVDACVMDPPYGTEDEGGGYGRRVLGARTIANDRDLSELIRVMPCVSRVLVPDTWLAVYCSPRRRPAVDDILAEHGFTHEGEIAWDKAQAGLGAPLRYNHETVVLYFRGTPSEPEGTLLSVWREILPRHLARGRHPHFKPPGLQRALVRFTTPIGGTVLDPFAGEATLGEAAINEGRGYLGAECDPQWWGTAERRLAEAQHLPHPDTEQPSIFGGAA